ncbi:MAG: hypothetical protein R8J94_19765 [Acidimicrobiia bacterium]|nr:hypothetical protein [Acidimicrobiia bacterium]
MTTQAGQDPSGANSIPSDIAAVMIWTASSAPPEVTLSFQGLAEPISLWQQLMALGWEVPPCPPRPGSAIEWVPDPVAGTDYTIRPWRVKEFRLGEGQWSREVGATIGATTYRILREFDATITGTEGPLAQLRAYEEAEAAKTAPLPAAAPAAAEAPPSSSPEAAAAAEAAATPTPAAAQQTVVFLETSQEAAEQHAETLTTWAAVVGRNKTPVLWSELAITPTIGAAEFNQLVAASNGAWLLDGDVPTAGGGQAIFRMIVPDADASDAKLAKVIKQFGGMVTMRDLRPATAEGKPAVLVSGSVPAHSYDMLHSNMRLRVPNGAARIEK